ncbi:DUF1566 domain-containing protein [Pseudomonas frederiksbergensis]|uniref:DUF1566 domain-containing protein n=1 Tax=Pseudomonas frederiksbergensis TaxID=104087 RepID=A0A423KIC6_9PSED|nr:DUF1566 domain-containing protein [Pseudomonas frederiksbergensis]RON52901.1 DUF1566 domain-containing protein [Pseudomonas frederiksbergensis]
MNTALNIQPPALGEVWPGQGGIYAGVMPARADAASYHMIIPATDIGRFEWGRYREESLATSLVDGKANTDALIAVGGHPAAEAARAYAADGHADFDLPAIAELYEIWLNLNGKIDAWYWSSSQRSADTAFGMDFGDGYQFYDGKNGELRVRPVRRLPI